MKPTFSCGDHEALITYAYDECETEAREAISAHLTSCHACAESVESLQSARHALAAWVPPDTVLGFQVTRMPGALSDGEGLGATGERAEEATRVPAAVVALADTGASRWWQRPLPAWAQAAAAVLVFASGLMIGMSGGTASPPAENGGTRIAAAGGAPGVPAASAAVSADDLRALEERLRGEIAARTASTVRIAPRTGDDALLRRVNAMIAESEARQRRELAMRTLEIVRDFDTQRRVDREQMQRTMTTTHDDVIRSVDYMMRRTSR